MWYYVEDLEENMVRHLTLEKKKKQCLFCQHCDYMKLRQQRGGHCKEGGYNERNGHCSKFVKEVSK